jgi:hypothetical protein
LKPGPDHPWRRMWGTSGNRTYYDFPLPPRIRDTEPYKTIFAHVDALIAEAKEANDGPTQEH